MTKRRKVVPSLLAVIFIIGGVTIHKLNEPKHVFEEIYKAEMHAANYKQHTPLSNTEYFKEQVAEYLNYDGGKLKTATVKESPKEDSIYTVEVKHSTRMGDGWSAQKQKIVDIDSMFRFRDIDINTHYHYILSSKGSAQGTLFDELMVEGLYVSFANSVSGRRISKYEDFFIYYGITEAELREQIDVNLRHILNYWVDNYADTKFKHDDFGAYEIVKFS
jgi:hypothetical protein